MWYKYDFWRGRIKEVFIYHVSILYNENKNIFCNIISACLCREANSISSCIYTHTIKIFLSLLFKQVYCLLLKQVIIFIQASLLFIIHADLFISCYCIIFYLSAKCFFLQIQWNLLHCIEEINDKVSLIVLKLTSCFPIVTWNKTIYAIQHLLI